MNAQPPQTTPPDRLDDASLAELMRKLSEQSSLLARREVELAKAELAAKGRSLGIGAGDLGAAGLVAVLALGALTATVILALAQAMDAWLAALIVTVVMAAVAAALGLAGRNRIRAATPPVPEQTVETVKEDVEWAKNQKPSART